MVEITKRGQLPGAKQYRGFCHNCGTEFKFLASEAREHSDQRDGDFLSITCPLPGCGTTVNVQKHLRFGVNDR